MSAFRATVGSPHRSPAELRAIPRTHTRPADAFHFWWDVENVPVLTIESGDTVVLRTREVTDDQITPSSTAEALVALDADRFYPLTGPIRIEGAAPGHALAVEILELRPGSWGRTIPAPQFTTSRPDPAAARSHFGTTGVGPHLYRAAQDAVRAIIDHLCGTYGLSREDAYVLSSLCVDLRISEDVDAGQYVVTALLPTGR